VPIRYDTQAEIPEAEQADFVPFQEDGRDIFVHKDFAESKREQFRLVGDNTTLTTELDSTRTKLTTFESVAAENARLAKEVSDAALLKAGRGSEIVDDLRNQLTEQGAAHTAALDQIKADTRLDKKKGVVAGIAAQGTPDTRASLQRLVAQDIDIADDGTVYVLGADGKATSETVEQYEAGLKNRYPSLVSAVPSKGGTGQGGAGGEAGQGGDKVVEMRGKVPALGDLPLN